MSSTPNSSPSAAIKIIETEPLAKLREGHSYWIRVVLDRRSSDSLYAVAAVRCENRQEIHWLSEGVPNPKDAVKLMRIGFRTTLIAESLGHEVIEKLVNKGSA